MIGRDSSVMKAWEATVRKTQAVAKKRANSIFGSTYMAHADDEDHGNKEGTNGREAHELYHAEKVLSNGDYYKGDWADNFPHGKGKYVWSDGCVYVGDWFRGKTNGKGRFSWPNGPNYEGEFKSGYMDGTGTYTASNGDVYKGQWVMNLKHGNGVKNFVNGDKYEGEWRRGMQEGQGRYEWGDGNYYMGEWKNGNICGKGSFFWGDGNRYDGYWEDGLPKGNGRYIWSDGSFYVGNWSKDPRDRSGAYYPAGSSEEGTLEWDPEEVFDALGKYEICEGEKVSVLPSQKRLAVWRSSKGGDCGKPRRMSIDGRVSVGVEKPSDRMQLWGCAEGDFSGTKTPPATGVGLDDELMAMQLDGAISRGTSQLQTLKAPTKSKRQGEVICKGHKNYELMLNLQLGIRYFITTFIIYQSIS